MNKIFSSFMLLSSIPLLLLSADLAAGYNPLNLNQYGSLSTQDLPDGTIGTDSKALVDTFAEGVAYDTSLVPSSWSVVDPSQVYLCKEALLKVWLVGEQAGMQNQVGISVGKDYTLNQGDPQVLFADTTTTPDNTPYDMEGTHRVREGNVGPGKLDFFLIGNGMGAGTVGADYNPANVGDYYLYWTDQTEPTADGYGQAVVNNGYGQAVVNADGGQHALAFLHSSGNFLMYAWEDLNYLFNDVGWGAADFDFNDTFFLVKAKDAICIVPEPETYLMMGGFLLIVGLVARKRRAAVKVKI